MANHNPKFKRGKHFYGQESHVHNEVSWEEANPALKIFALLTFGMVLAGALCLAIGVWKDFSILTMAGVCLICFMTFPMMKSIGLTLTEEQSESIPFRVCRILFPAIGTFLAVVILGAQFVSDVDAYILTVAGIALPLIFIGCGILLIGINKKQDARYGRCTAEVWATVIELEQKQDRMNLSSDIVIDDSYNPLNLVTFYTPVFRYDFNGQTYEECPTVSSGDMNQNLTVGQQVKLRINPDNPKELFWLPTSRQFLRRFGILMLAGGIAGGLIEMVLLKILL